MSGKAIATITGLVVAIVMSCVAVALVGAGEIGIAACVGPAPTAATALASGPQPASGGGWPAVGGWNSQQVANAAVIVSVGQQMHVPPRGWVIAVATAMQESSLTNLGHLGSANDDDSLGLFQQRSSQGWGTLAQIMNPVHASTEFYAHLHRVPHWQVLPLTDAAQAVQRSAAPGSYAKWENDAVSVVAAVVSSGNRAMSVDLEQCLSNCPAILSTSGSNDPSAAPSREARSCEWVAPVRAPVVSGFRTRQRPTHNGVDLGAVRGTPIRAASAGTVVVVRCNIVPAEQGCDRDGSPATPGCGWYLDLRHAGEVYTRYCHMFTRPAVVEGQAVAAGQVIGVVGSSGHSSGPHLHFEVHVGSRSEGAVDPVLFMAGRGVRLG